MPKFSRSQKEGTVSWIIINIYEMLPLCLELFQFCDVELLFSALYREIVNPDGFKGVI